jgi:predicted PurR-regulated permease PerM
MASRELQRSEQETRRDQGNDADHRDSHARELAAPPPLDAGPDTLRAERRSLRASSFHYCLVLACVAAALTLVPLWAPLLLASWMAMVFRPLHAKLARRVRGKAGAAAVVTVLLVVLTLTPLVVMGVSLVGAAASLIERMQEAGGAREALQKLLESEPSLPKGQLNPDQFQLDAQQIMGFAKQSGGGALTAASRLFGAATAAAIAVFVFVYGFYVFLVDTRRIYQWLLDHSPLERWQTQRLAAAYAETGRGLLIGVGLTALFQGAVATVGYLIIGVPQALVLGLVTTFAALIPSIGTGLVWAPLALGLLLAGRTGEAAAVVGLGCAISVADNFIRPALSRHARLDLPMFLLFVAMLGGMTMFGTWGLLVGPLFVRLCVEALRVGRERRELGDTSPLLRPDGEELPYVPAPREPGLSRDGSA